MKVKVRWLTIFLVMGLVLAACSPAEVTTTTEDVTATTAPTATTEGPTATTEGPTATTEAAMEIVDGPGVDVENKVIKLGYLSDLSGPFAPLVGAINLGHEFYWTGVNAAGGIDGWTVEMVVRDTGYSPDNHVQFYQELKAETAAIAQSTGSPHSLAIRADLEASGILAIPLTWFSGWTDETINANLLHHGMPYCVEAHNILGYLQDNNDVTTVAIASVGGDYGLDSAAGAVQAAATLGLDVVYDGSGAIIQEADGAANPDEIANAIVAADPDIVFLTGRSTDTEPIYSLAIGQGLEAFWTGAFPSISPRFIAPGSPIAEQAARDFIVSLPWTPWAAQTEGIIAFSEQVLAAGLPASEFYTEGVVEATMMHRILEQAIANGDLTQAGILATAKSIESLDMGGIAPNESYVGDMNAQLQRVGNIIKFDVDSLLSGGTGFASVEANYTHQSVADYDFTGACYVLGS